MGRVYTALVERYGTDEAIRAELRITARHLELIKTDSKLPRWLLLSLVRDHEINPLYIFGLSKKKFIQA